MAQVRLAVAAPAVAEEGSACPDPALRDWAGNRRTLALLWGVPAGAMLAAALLEPLPRAVV